MILTADYHTHTPYSHGENTVLENVLRAKELGLKEIGISDHGFAHITYGIRRKKFADYKRECEEAEKETGLRVLVGMEANILSESGATDMLVSDYKDFDIFLCGAHVFVRYESGKDRRALLWSNLLKTSIDARAKRNTQTYIGVIKNNPVDILTHIGYRFPCDAVEVAKCASDYGTYIELNSKKQHLTDEELSDSAMKTSARFVIDSDAHSAKRVGEVSLVEEHLKRVNFPMDRIDNIDGRTPIFRFKKYKEKI